ncbi:MAG: tRNA (adenosine(37)-N6)-dimethylallyltransferase MiaA [Desulfobacterales bacterium]|nr:tRNA (adenosine(37)-N6)-dimethylallyltransferase MiaA [Desulfobacterales bacterium]
MNITDDHRQKLIIITGPTASGKSSLAVDLALYFEGEIVNADSMQVYRGMDVGTAKPTMAERRGIPHHLIDVADPDEAFNAGVYRALSLPVIEEMKSRQKVCFVVGGTGLYIRTLLGGLLNCPPSDPSLREELRRQMVESGPALLHKRLEGLDPESAQKIHPHDKVRIMRALEVIELAKEPFSELTRRHGFGNRPFQALKFCLQRGREDLYHRINARCLRMIESGLVRETQGLLESGYSADLKAMQSLGYRHMVSHLEGRWDMDETIARLQRDTRRYAKRQLTWFRADPLLVWTEPDDKETMITRIRTFIRAGRNEEDS